MAGAIAVDSSGSGAASLAVINSTFYDNSAGGNDGGAIYSNLGGDLSVVNNTFVDNNASSGAAIYDAGSSASETVENDIFSGNLGGSAVTLAGGSRTEEYNLFYNNTAGDGLGGTYGTGDLVNKDPNLVPLGNYGGRTETIMPELDSPAVCAGDKSALTAALGDANALDPSISISEDERGFPIVGDFAQCGTSPLPGTTNNVDIGAVQTNYIAVGNGNPLGAAIKDADQAGEDTDIGFNLVSPQTFSSPSSYQFDHGGSTVIIGPRFPTTVTISGQVTNARTGNLDVSLFIVSGHFLSLYGLTLANNTNSIFDAGAITDEGTVNVSNCIFSNDHGILYGGAIYDGSGAQLTVIDSTFYGNSAEVGGAIFGDNGSTVSITNNTFYDNSALGSVNCLIGNCEGHGGAVYLEVGGSIVNNTFSHNWARWAGGALWDGTATPFSNNIFANNTSGGVLAGEGSDSASCAPEQNNLYYENYDSRGRESYSVCAYPGSQYGSEAQDVFVPSTNPSPVAALGYYGGPTPTMPPFPGSAAVCAGSPGAVPNGITTDQRDFPRLNTTYSASSPCIDIGSVQTNYLVVSNATDTKDGTPNCDLAGDSPCSLRDAIALATAAAADVNHTDIGFSSPFSINLGSPLDLSQGDIAIIGPESEGQPSVILNGQGKWQIFQVSGPSTSVSLHGLFLENGSGANGGAINNTNGATVNVSDSYLYNNSATNGGAIYTDGASAASVTGSTFDTNQASNFGGGIDSAGTLAVTDSTFYKNSAAGSTGYGGGAIYSTGALGVGNSTFFGNTGYEGGGIDNSSSGTATIADDIFSNNVDGASGNGAGIYSTGTIPGSTKKPGEQYNLFYENYIYNSTTEDDTNIGYGTGDVQDPNTNPSPVVGELADNGGPTPTMLPLPSDATDGSAICQGTASEPHGLSLFGTDQRGFPRQNTTYTGFSATSPCIDIGSVQTDYQSIQFTNIPTDTNGNPVPYTDNSPAPNVSVTENGQNIGGVPVTLGISPTPGSVANATATTSAGEGATFSDLTVSPGGTYTLSSTLPLFDGPNTTTPVSIETDSATNPTLVVGTPTTTTVYAPAQGVYGNYVTLTAVVTAQSGTSAHTGTVVFTVNSTALTPSVTVGTCPANTPGATSLSQCASYSFGPLVSGPYNVLASFAPDSPFVASQTSSPVSITVEPVLDYVGSITTLSSGNVNSLTKEWDKAISMGSDGKYNGAINNLNNFIAEVNDLLSSNVLTQDQATTLINAANYQIGQYQQGLQ